MAQNNFFLQILCKVVTMLSKDTVEHLLLPRFCDLCSDGRLFQVRKVTLSNQLHHKILLKYALFSKLNFACVSQVCAANFGEFCSIVGQEATEKLLVSLEVIFFLR